jgi:hypothetical protein
MNTINKLKHQQLLKSLFLLEMILKHDPEQSEDVSQITTVKNELEILSQSYDTLFTQLQEIAVNYDVIYKQLKYQYLLKKLKFLKKSKGIRKEDSITLQRTIQLSYGI